jgi:hypothetical protein
MIDLILSMGVDFLIATMIAFAFLVYMVEQKITGGAIFMVALYVGVVHFAFCKGWTPVDIVGWVKAHALDVALGAVVYFMIGTVWAFIKWWSFVKRERRRYDEVFNDFIKNHADLKDVPLAKWSDDMVRQFNYCLTSKVSYDNQIRVKPQVENFKEEIFLWIGFWPFSAFWTIIDDPIRRICSGIYNLIGKRLQAISDSAWSGVDK